MHVRRDNTNDIENCVIRVSINDTKEKDSDPLLDLFISPFFSIIFQAHSSLSEYNFIVGAFAIAKRKQKKIKEKRTKTKKRKCTHNQKIDLLTHFSRSFLLISLERLINRGLSPDNTDLAGTRI